MASVFDLSMGLLKCCAYKLNSSELCCTTEPDSSPNFLTSRSCAIWIASLPELAYAFCANLELCLLFALGVGFICWLGTIALVEFVIGVMGPPSNKGCIMGSEIESKKLSIGEGKWLSMLLINC